MKRLLIALAVVAPFIFTPAQSQKANANSIVLPAWNYTIESPRDGQTYSGVIVGSDPFSQPDATTIIPTQVVPVILRFEDGDIVLDPTLMEPCVDAQSGASGSVLTRFLDSPVFQNTAFTFNGVDVGTTQYLDAFQRANFSTVIGGRPYHVLLSPTVLAPVTIDVPAQYGHGRLNTFGQTCGYFGVVEGVDWFRDLIAGTILLGLAAQGVGPATFPIFLLQNVHLLGIGGYHGVVDSQTYAVVNFDTTWRNRCFTGTIIGCPADVVRSADIAPITPVLASWLNDPLVANPSPSWGLDRCSTHFDVFSLGTNLPPVVMPNGFWYHIPHMPYFSWFFGGLPLGAGGSFSTLATFRREAKLCPPGGTNPTIPGDMDADGTADLVWRNTQNGDMWMGDSRVFESAGVPLEWQIEGVNDLDDQGSSDLVWRNTQTGNVDVWLVIDRVAQSTLSANPTAWVKQAVSIATGVPFRWNIVDVEDVDGDRKADLIWYDHETGDVAVWLMDGAEVTSTPIVATALPLTWQIADVADIDGDKRADIVWRHVVSGDVAVWLMDGASVKAGPVISSGVPLTWQLVAAADLDGDRKADLIWHDGATGDVAAWLMNGLSVRQSGVVSSAVPQPWQIVTVLDYDGDEKSDLVWQNLHDNTYSVWLMDGLRIKGHAAVFVPFPAARLN